VAAAVRTTVRGALRGAFRGVFRGGEPGSVGRRSYVVRLLEVFEAMGLYAATAFEFVTPDAPHRAHDPRHPGTTVTGRVS
jgi:hypothetical protein